MINFGLFEIGWKVSCTLVFGFVVDCWLCVGGYMGDNGMDIGDFGREVGIELVMNLRDDGGVGGCNLRYGSVD